MPNRPQRNCYFVLCQMMEGIVYGIANINFQQNLLELGNDICLPNFIPTLGTEMASSTQQMFQHTRELPVERQSNADANNSSDEEDADDNSWEEAEDDVDANADTMNERKEGARARKSMTLSERRQLPSRASKDNSLVGTKRRTIMKPTKRNSSVHKDFNNLTPAQIKKIYMNKKLTKFKPSSLETIFEESADNFDEESTTHGGHVIGARKLRRVIAFQDCFVANKALIKKRRAKIRKVIGRRPALIKISLQDFIEKFNSSMEEKQTTNTPTTDEMDEGYCHLDESSLPNIEKISGSMPVANVSVSTEALSCPVNTLTMSAAARINRQIQNSVVTLTSNVLHQFSISIRN